MNSRAELITAITEAIYVNRFYARSEQASAALTALEGLGFGDVAAARNAALEEGYLAGFDASGEGWNAEYPFDDGSHDPKDDPAWIEQRTIKLNALKSAPPEPKP